MAGEEAVVTAIAIVIGAILTVLGVGGYFLTGQVSATALIPAAFGILFIALGALAQNDKWRKHAMHLAVALAALGIAGAFEGVISVIKLWSGTQIARPGAAYSRAIMVVACLVFLILGIRSFVTARRRPAGEPS